MSPVVSSINLSESHNFQKKIKTLTAEFTTLISVTSKSLQYRILTMQYGSLVQQVILEKRASLYCCTFVVEPSFLVLLIKFGRSFSFSLHRHLLQRLYFARSSRQNMLCREERTLLIWGKRLKCVKTSCHWIYTA